ncbi:hypothetical protein [Escherichia ruysiae]|uniref:hypothetical protein n=1 Tax=Escherichia ruysiae TaxID=2608867 RepID=UPI001C9A4BA0|nr:hypothetical protein [Escherichia ruysiae]MBY7354144.1 hypothetical protein [Escherichia ruysiae]
MLVTMTDRELYRLGIIQRVFDRALLQLFMDDATGRLMHLRFCDSENAFDYMMATQQYIDNKRYRELGPAGLVSQLRGKPGNHQLNTAIRDQTLQFIRTRGRGMNPSAIWRILTTEYGVRISKETVRKMMITTGALRNRLGMTLMFTGHLKLMMI